LFSELQVDFDSSVFIFVEMINGRDYDLFREKMTMPFLTPDIIDDFVSWLTGHGYDMYSFQISDIAFRKKMFSQFLKETCDDHQQHKIHFPDPEE
jgi:hypothetical protein